MKVDRQTIQLQQALASAEHLAAVSDAGLIKAVAEVLRSVTPQAPLPAKGPHKLSPKEAKAAAKAARKKGSEPVADLRTTTEYKPTPRPAAQPFSRGALERAIKHVIDYAQSEAKTAESLSNRIVPLRPPEPEPEPEPATAKGKGKKAKPAKVKAAPKDPNADLRFHLSLLLAALDLARNLVELVSEE